MIKLSKTTENNLRCLCGLCEHDTYDKSCPYARMLEAEDPNKYLYNAISRLIKTEITAQEKKKNANTKTKSK